MPWSKETVEKQRLRFVKEVEDGFGSITELSRDYGISRVTAHKWIERYRNEGVKGLLDLSRKPIEVKDPTSMGVVFEIVKIRSAHCSWGGRTIGEYLKKQKGMKEVPHPRTIDRILKRCGLVSSVPRKKPFMLSREDIIEAKECNDVWTVDFKGWWLTGDNKRCEPLTIRDSISRLLVGIDALEKESFEAAKASFIKAFKQYGLPRVIRSDNGPPFRCTQSLCALTRLSVWWLKLGIIPNRMSPGSPQENAAHERMHKDMKKELQAKPERNLKAQQERFDTWRYDFNFVRPHHSLDMRTPSEVYRASKRKYAKPFEDYSYPSNFEVGSIRKNGQFWWGKRSITFSEAFSNEQIGIEPFNKDTFRVWYRNFCLGMFDRNFQVKASYPIPRAQQINVLK